MTTACFSKVSTTLTNAVGFFVPVQKMRMSSKYFNVSCHLQSTILHAFCFETLGMHFVVWKAFCRISTPCNSSWKTSYLGFLEQSLCTKANVTVKHREYYSLSEKMNTKLTHSSVCLSKANDMHPCLHYVKLMVVGSEIS